MLILSAFCPPPYLLQFLAAGRILQCTSAVGHYAALHDVLCTRSLLHNEEPVAVPLLPPLLEEPSGAQPRAARVPGQLAGSATRVFTTDAFHLRFPTTGAGLHLSRTSRDSSASLNTFAPPPPKPHTHTLSRGVAPQTFPICLKS